MRKLASLVLALILLSLPAISLAQDATAAEPADGWTDEAASGESDETAGEWTDESGAATNDEAEIDVGQVAEKAHPLYSLIARALYLGAKPFNGAPDAETAWSLTYAALEQGAVEGLTDGEVSLDSLNNAYAAIFTEGELPDMPTDFSLLDLENDTYHQISDPGDGEYTSYLVTASESDGVVTAEVASMAANSEVPEDLTALMSVSLVPNEASPFGATLSGFAPITGSPAMTKAEATKTLKKYKDITYAAGNVLDGDYTTCWSYPKEDEGAVLTLSSEDPQAVRGIRLTPAYAKSEKLALANNRVKSFHVELSDGTGYDFTVDPDMPGNEFECYAAFAFGGVHEITWASITVTSVYPGSKYTDTCISEIALF